MSLFIAIPRNPTNLGNASITYQSVSLSWIAPSDTGGCAIINYIITVTPLDGSDPWNITTTDNSTSYIVTGLMFGQSYNFTVRANNSIGLGEESNSLTVLIPGEGMTFEYIQVFILLWYSSSVYSWYRHVFYNNRWKLFTQYLLECKSLKFISLLFSFVLV